MPLLLVFPLYMGNYGGHIMPKNAPPTCPLCAPPISSNTLKKLDNRGGDWVANSPCLKVKQGLSGHQTGAVSSLNRGCLLTVVYCICKL